MFKENLAGFQWFNIQEGKVNVKNLKQHFAKECSLFKIIINEIKDLQMNPWVHAAPKNVGVTWLPTIRMRLQRRLYGMYTVLFLKNNDFL